MSSNPIRFAMTSSSIRAVISALVDEALAAGLAPCETALCRIGHRSGDLLLNHRGGDQFLPVIPWQPHWGEQDAYQQKDMPLDLKAAISGLQADITQSSWVVFLTKAPNDAPIGDWGAS